MLLRPRWTPGCRANPTNGLSKEDAAKAFTAWYRDLGPGNIVAFTDGSKGVDGIGYGYAITVPTNNATRATGLGSLDATAEVYDAEALGALRGLEKAIEVAHPDSRIHVCLDNTAVIWGLRASAPISSQWVFKRFHELADSHSVSVRWCPGHMKIAGNERADKLAKDGQKAARDPGAAPTIAGVKRLLRGTLRRGRDQRWEAVASKLSWRYRWFNLQHDDSSCPEELSHMNRRLLHHFLAVRSGHGDFEWYHRKFRHDNANTACSCGAKKEPFHFVKCRKTLAKYSRWPWPNKTRQRPPYPPTTGAEWRRYARELMDSPKAFVAFEKETGFWSRICPR
jgi:ribonuclease HI